MIKRLFSEKWPWYGKTRNRAAFGVNNRCTLLTIPRPEQAMGRSHFQGERGLFGKGL